MTDRKLYRVSFRYASTMDRRSLLCAWIPRTLLAILAITLLPLPAVAGAQSETYSQVLSLFDNAAVVFLGERHWSQQDSDYRIGLIQHPQFAARVDDVVIEFGNSLYQNILDAYFLNLADVTTDELSQVWRNTTQTQGVWDSPIYERFLRELRNVNERLPSKDRVRVVAAGPPIDWGQVEVWEDRLPFMHRGWTAVRLIEREVLARHRRALVITGRGNVQRKDDEMDEDDNEVRRIEALHPERRFAVVVPVGIVEANAPRFEDHVEGIASFPVYIDLQASPFREWPAPRYLPGTVGRLGEIADALIYFGADDEQVAPPADFYIQHPEYSRELGRRRSMKRRLPRKSYN